MYNLLKSNEIKYVEENESELEDLLKRAVSGEKLSRLEIPDFEDLFGDFRDKLSILLSTLVSQMMGDADGGISVTVKNSNIGMNNASCDILLWVPMFDFDEGCILFHIDDHSGNRTPEEAIELLISNMRDDYQNDPDFANWLVSRIKKAKVVEE